VIGGPHDVSIGLWSPEVVQRTRARRRRLTDDEREPQSEQCREDPVPRRQTHDYEVTAVAPSIQS
jgi:hypothetical protein